MARSSFYYHQLQNKKDKYHEVKVLIQSIYHHHKGRYGYRRITDELKKKGVVQSTSRKGNCWDNAISENFFGILKSELFYLKKFNSIEELKNEIKQYIYYYNNERTKSNLNKMSSILSRTHFYTN